MTFLLPRCIHHIDEDCAVANNENTAYLHVSLAKFDFGIRH